MPEEWPYDARNWRGLSGDKVVYMNPPYGRKLPLCMKAANVANPPVWALVPSRLGTKWWDEYVRPFHRIQFLQRISFYDSFGRVRKNTPFSSTLVGMEFDLDVVNTVAQRMVERVGIPLRIEVGS